ncbi:MAG TPA: DUF4190 domain-containing protein [Verrucomicrobiae bacterium]|jgi:hypothetical protein|nr:DUF4190 domain-containing protein [Verrucomicrobiae bacterium]
MYKILGADGRQYGPVTVDQIRRWIVEGRANAYTQTLVEGATEWKPLGLLPEFAASFPGAAAPPAMSPVVSYQRKTNGYALWGMICGIVAVFFCLCCCLSIPLGALGLIFSLIGLSQINELPDVYEGRGMAIVGIILSALGLGLGIMMLFADAANGHFNFHHYHHFSRY